MRPALLASFLACAAGCSLLYPLDYRTAPHDATAPDVADAPTLDGDGSTQPACPPGFDRCTGGACMDTRTSTDHCGRCNNVCALSNATPACDMGSCVVAACNPGYDDCDGDPANGCEANTQTGAAHCGSCSRVCPTEGGATACREGVCRVGTCAAGFGNCDGSDANGCETDTRTAVAHCGGCGMACAPRAHATASCAAGACAYMCEMGFADCDMDPSNGCEADIRTAAAHCGGCGRACLAAGGTATCADGRCALTCDASHGDCNTNPADGCETDTLSNGVHCGACNRRCAAGTSCSRGACVAGCPAGQTTCSGSCVDPATNPAHCGGCDRACPTGANATATCSGGVCGLACAPGFDNCDGNAANGCETPLTGTANCGRCGRSCPAPEGGAATCVGGMCGVACSPGRGDCDRNPGNGCEVNLGSSTEHCGACGQTCAPRNARGACVNGACTIEDCSSGFADCDGNPANGCEVDTRADPANCGNCGRACAFAHAGATCTNSMCRIGACNMGWGNCNGASVDGCEVNLATSTEHCMRCNNACGPGSVCGSGGCCGGSGAACCPPGNTCYASGAADGRCVMGRCTTICGGRDQLCCPFGSPCFSGLTCRLGVCRAG